MMDHREQGMKHALEEDNEELQKEIQRLRAALKAAPYIQRFLLSNPPEKKKYIYRVDFNNETYWKWYNGPRKQALGEQK